MNHLLNILDGFASVIDFHLKVGRPYVNRRNGFAVDQQNLRRDVVIVGSDIRQTIRRYGEQSGSSARYQQKR